MPGEAGGEVGVVTQLKGNTGDVITYLRTHHQYRYLDRSSIGISQTALRPAIRVFGGRVRVCLLPLICEMRRRKEVRAGCHRISLAWCVEFFEFPQG